MHEIHHPAPTREPIDGRKYGGKWIAIRYRRIIDFDRDLEALCNRLEAKGIEEKVELMKVPPPGIVFA